MANVAPTARRRSRDRGFTLIEVLVALVQIGILAAVVTAMVGGTAGSGRERACRASAAAARTASIGFRASHERYPRSIAEMVAPPAAVVLPAGVRLNTSEEEGHAAGTRAIADGWILTMVPGLDEHPPSFQCLWFDEPLPASPTDP